MQYTHSPSKQASADAAVNKSTDAFAHLTSRMFVPLLLIMLILAACDTPMAVAPEGGADGPFATSAIYEADDDTEGIMVMEEDGSLRALTSNEAATVLEAPGDNRVAVHVVGRATYNHSTIKQLQFNVRQTKAGDIAGVGRVTIGDHTTDVTPRCITQNTSWGRTHYGVGVELAEPYVFTTPYGTAYYTHAVFSITADGRYTGLITARDRVVCGASALRDPFEVATGNLQVIQ